MSNLFGDILQEYNNSEGMYTSKIKHPTYVPSPNPPSILELIDDSKSKRLIAEIQASKVTDLEKAFLIEAAKRHTIFNYSKIADYYASASPAMQDQMERSALVIIDFYNAIQYGYIELSSEIAQQYVKDYGDEK